MNILRVVEAGVIRGYDALRYMAWKADLEHPERIGSSNLRKFMATMTQVYDLIENSNQFIVIL